MVLLCGCPTVDLGDDPPDVGLCNPTGGLPYFQNEIVPKYLKLSDKTTGCGRSSACHDRSHGLAFDLLNPTSTQNYRLTQNYLNCGSPMQSDLLTKPLAGIVGHGGGDLIQPGSTEEDVFLEWF
jgi:hypothetical protein